MFRHLFISALLFVSSISFIYSDAESSEDDLGMVAPSSLNPISYFGEGEYFSGFFVIGFWVALIWGVFTLVMLVLGKHINFK